MKVRIESGNLTSCIWFLLVGYSWGLLAVDLCDSVKCKFTVVDLMQSKADNFGLEIAQYCLCVSFKGEEQLRIMFYMCKMNALKHTFHENC